ncbi:MAG: hypothetical protein AAGJ40_22980 [Planctomycetota bacterium]
MKKESIGTLLVLMLSFSVGCRFLPKSAEDVSPVTKLKPVTNLTTNATSDSVQDVDPNSMEKRVSNPQAREIRFDGQELVLGGGDCQSIRVDALRTMTDDLRERGRHRSAVETIRLHRRSASRWVMESFAEKNDDTVRWVAGVLDRDRNNQLHSQLCDAAERDPGSARSFRESRQQCLESLAGGAVSGGALEQLSLSAASLEAPLAVLEAERLSAMSEIVSGDTIAAGDRLAAVADQAAQAGSADQCAQLWLLASETYLRAESLDASVQSWQNAIRAQVTAMTVSTSRLQGQDATSLPPLDTVFWEQADHLRPPSVEFPPEVALAMNAWKLRLGLGQNQTLTPVASLWSAVAAYQLATGQAHLATLSIKRAEVEATDTTKPWLQIALARSMAAQGQTPVATTILGTLTTHDSPRVRAASLAALGSIKVHAGAYEQGSRFLVEALAVDCTSSTLSVAGNAAEAWPGHLAAEADLANVRLIVGDLGEARDSLHAIQQKLALQGRWQSLVQSLENEAAIIELDGDKKTAEQIRRRVLEMERHPA